MGRSRRQSDGRRGDPGALPRQPRPARLSSTTFSIGEIAITGAAAAIANAIFNATGKRVRDLPITLDKLL